MTAVNLPTGEVGPSLEDVVVLVTGGSRGLGLTMAKALLNEGARVCVSARDRQALQALIDDVQEPGRISALAADLEVAGECERLAAEAVEIHGRVDVLINNAAMGPNRVRDAAGDSVRFSEVSPDLLDSYLSLNVAAPTRLAALLAPAMCERGWGRIVNVTTNVATMFRHFGYGPSKAALDAQTAIMARDLDGTGVTANTLAPGGAAATDMTADMNRPAGLLLAPEVMAAPTVWLSSRASDGVTGRRFVARLWDPEIDPSAAAVMASTPLTWS